MIEKSDIENRQVGHVSHREKPFTIGALDLEDDPHRAALEDNPEKAEVPSWSTLLAVLVS